MNVLQHLINEGTVTAFEDSLVWWPKGDLLTPGSLGIILTDEQIEALRGTDIEEGGEA